MADHNSLPIIRLDVFLLNMYISPPAGAGVLSLFFFFFFFFFSRPALSSFRRIFHWLCRFIFQIFSAFWLLFCQPGHFCAVFLIFQPMQSYLFPCFS